MWHIAMPGAGAIHSINGGPWLATELLTDVVDAGTAAGGAQKFPEAASFRISFSSVGSETALRSRFR